jgi:predicted aspartyl protease
VATGAFGVLGVVAGVLAATQVPVWAVAARYDAPPANLTPADETLDQVMTRLRAARYNGVSVYRERWKVESAGLEGTTTIGRYGEDVRVDRQFGPFVSASGTYHGQEWHTTYNGQTVLKSGIHRREEIDSLALERGHLDESDGVTLLGMSASPRAYVLQVSPRGGRLKWLFVDPASGRVVHAESVYGHQRLIIDYGDFRTEGKRTFAHASRWVYADGTDPGTETLVNDEEDPAGLDLRIPPSTRDLLEFPPGVTHVEIPSKFLDNHVIIRITIGGRGLDCFLDSGASSIYLDPRITHQLGLPQYGKTVAQSTHAITLSQTIVPEIDVAGIKMHNVAITSGPMDQLVTGDVEAVGLVGFDFINGAVIHIDYQHEKVEAIRSDDFHPETIPGVFAIPVALDDGVPLAPVKVGDTVSRRFIVDTGSSLVMLFSQFAEAHPDDVEDQGRGEDLSAKGAFLFLFWGVGGLGSMRPTELKSIQFGQTKFADFMTMRTVSAGDFEGDDFDGLIGTEFLRFFDVYFDYANGRIVLAPNDTHRGAVAH